MATMSEPDSIRPSATRRRTSANIDRWKSAAESSGMSSVTGTLLEKLPIQEALATGRATSRNDANQVSAHVHNNYKNDTSCDRANTNKAILVVGVIDIEDLEIIGAGR
jgi:hypothetical protein